jgi:hypothetical protein
MTWAQVYDGVAAYSHAASNVSTPNGFVFKARFRILSLPSGNGQIHIGIGTGTEQIGIGGQANGQFRIQVRNTGVNIPGSIVLNQWYDFEMSQPAGAGFRDITSFLDAVQVDTRGKPSPALGGHPLFIGANTALSSFLECDIETIEYTELTTGSDDGLWDATASSHAAGTPILTDTINSNNTTGVNMATGGTVANGGVWLDLGGSGISIVVDSGTYSQTGTITPINAQLNITTTAGSYLLTGSDVNLTSAKKLITETGSYNLTGTDVTLIYTPGGGGETLIVDSGVYSLAGDEVLLRADLSIIANSDDYSVAGTATPIKYNASIIVDSGSYSSLGTDLNLFANYGMIVLSTSYTLTGTSVTLKYSGDTNQIIGTVTAGFAPDLYSAGYKPNTITVTFKE